MTDAADSADSFYDAGEILPGLAHRPAPRPRPIPSAAVEQLRKARSSDASGAAEPSTEVGAAQARLPSQHALAAHAPPTPSNEQSNRNRDSASGEPTPNGIHMASKSAMADSQQQATTIASTSIPAINGPSSGSHPRTDGGSGDSTDPSSFGTREDREEQARTEMLRLNSLRHSQQSGQLHSVLVDMERPTQVPNKYSTPHDIFYAERAPEADINILKIVKEVITGVKHGADVTNINLPATVLDPVSTLEKSMKSMQRGELMQLIDAAETPLDRFVSVLRFYFSGLVKEKFGKKPYNPILGEVFRSTFTHRENGGSTVLLAEQVSHHPPVTAIHLCNETLGFKMNSYTAAEPRFWGNSVEVKLNGMIRVSLEKHEEEYELTRPQLHMSGFLAGKHKLEFLGRASAKCEKSRYAAELDFKGKGPFGRGELNFVQGRIYNMDSNETVYELSGQWDGVLKLNVPGKSDGFVMFDYASAVADYSMCAVLPPMEEREPTFSSTVWAKCSDAIWKSDTLAANSAKRDVEDMARGFRRERDAAKKEWQPIYFQKRPDGKEGYVLRDGLRETLMPTIELTDEDRKIIAETQRSASPQSAMGTSAAAGKKKKLLGLSRKKD